MGEARKRLAALDDDEPGCGTLSRLFAGGFAMDNMKALAFAEAEMPLHLAPEALAQSLAEFASILVKSAKVVELMLTTALRLALLGEKSKAGADSALLESPRERLWDETESDFHRLLDELVALGRDDEGSAVEPLKQSWRRMLGRSALTIFDDMAPIDEFDEIDPERVVGARKLLSLGVEGIRKVWPVVLQRAGHRPAGSLEKNAEESSAAAEGETPV